MATTPTSSDSSRERLQDDPTHAGSNTTPSDCIRVGILTISDRCFRGIYQDMSGDVLVSAIKANTSNFSWEVVERRCIRDDQLQISMALIKWCDVLKLDLILTTGGTGFAKSDLTPEATKPILDKETPGITTAILMESLKITPMAMLSRLVSGIRKRTLVINFPGSPKACSECINVIKPIVKHAVDLLRDNKDADEAHKKMFNLESKVNIIQVARRNRESPYPLVTVEQAHKKILDRIYKMQTVDKKIKDALGFILASNIIAKEPYPPFRASMKDGYAVIAIDGIGSRKVVSSSLAGFDESDDIVLKSGECMRITTGAPVPKGASAIVQVEDTLLVTEGERGESEIIVEILKPPRLGQDIREVGSDLRKDELIAEAGTVLTPAALGVLATAGYCKVPVISKPKLAVMSTGNELQPPELDLQPGKIRDSNKTTLLALLEENGYSGFDCGIVPDDPKTLLNLIYHALKQVDILITTGGVSMGERDLIADVLIEDLKAELFFGRVNMKPGKPTKFFYLPMEDGPKYIFALPGNPVSAVVTCHLFVFPTLRAMSGWPKPLPMLFKVKTSADIKLDERFEYARATLIWNEGDNIPSASLTGNQVSSRLMNMVDADCLLYLPASTVSLKVLPAGTIVDAQLIKRHLTRFSVMADR